MNNLPFSTHRMLALALWTCSALAASAQTAPPAAAIQQADFIVAVVNSEPVTNREVQARRTRLWRELGARGGTMPSAQALTQQALEVLISEKVQLLQAQEQGLKIDDEQVDQAEANLAAGNQMSLAALHQRLSQEGLTPQTLRQQLRDQLTLARLREREVDARIRISDSDITQFLDAQVQDSTTPPDINIAQILIAVPEGASEADVKTREAQAREITQRVRQGEDFAQLAKTLSQASDKGQAMGLKSAERYPDIFVEAVRTLAVQAVSDPVRSGAGFHILKLLERRQTGTGLTVVQTHARHILLRPSAQMSREQAVTQLQEVRQQILAGRVSFARAAQALSQDASAQQGGDLGWVGPGQFVPEFEQVMNRLPLNQVSEPLVSRFGVHILEVTERRRVAVPEKEQRELARAALREQKLEETYERWLEEIRGRAYVEMRDPPTVLPLPVSAKP